jgi:hypothetical protein
MLFFFLLFLMYPALFLLSPSALSRLLVLPFLVCLSGELGMPSPSGGSPGGSGAPASLLWPPLLFPSKSS